MLRSIEEHINLFDTHRYTHDNVTVQCGNLLRKVAFTLMLNNNRSVRAGAGNRLATLSHQLQRQLQNKTSLALLTNSSMLIQKTLPHTKN